jgi:4-hydroxythreonine-4-phosphate dehydrogenase
METEVKDIKIGITQGDINGIGYEIILKTLIDPRINEICTPIVYGSSKVASYHRKLLSIGDFTFNIIKNPTQAHSKKPNLINIVDTEIKVDIGESTQVASEMAILSLEMATADLIAGKIDAVVTAPINKSNMKLGNFPFPGHSEYFAKAAGSDDYLMFMISPAVRVGVATGHIPISDVPKKISKSLLVKKIAMMHKSLVEDFGIRRPKIAVLGLNPHAGDEGVLGHEDGEIIFPAIREAFDKNILAFGPYPADGFFGSAQFTKFDAILAMYHDQGLIPFKILANNEGVNFTAALPFIRTSPGHGTAYEIAGKDIASPDSFRKAMYDAIDICRNRQDNFQ